MEVAPEPPKGTPEYKKWRYNKYRATNIRSSRNWNLKNPEKVKGYQLKIKQARAAAALELERKQRLELEEIKQKKIAAEQKKRAEEAEKTRQNAVLASKASHLFQFKKSVKQTTNLFTKASICIGPNDFL